MRFVFILVISIYVQNIKCQICTERVLFPRYVPQTYTRFVTVTYYGSCFYKCIKTRSRVVQDVRLVQKTIVDERKFCCEGFMANVTSRTLQCDPICSPVCENGYCSEPGRCTCNDGYAPSLEMNHKCVPICEKTCDHGTCIEPNKCLCNFGYLPKNFACVPICNDPCLNGTCIAPDTCECLPGYRKSKENMCRPYCSNGCTHGTCVSPENCTCDYGYLKNEPDGICQPHCDYDCGHGKCVSPNICECSVNFTKSENGTCVPHCLSGCPHGTCVGPENCTCNDGWFKSEPGGICQPHCDNGCGNGTCVSPNVCKCFANYTKSENGSCVPYCSTGCPYGICISPEFCECDSGWYKNGTECKPICNYTCGNGTCILPNVCQCFPGYKIDINTILGIGKGVLCVPECNNCYGKCVAPKKCVCDLPYVAENIAADGSSCDCFGNCFEGAKKCVRTECVYRETTTSFITDLTNDLISTYDIDITFGEDDATSYTLGDDSIENVFNGTADIASMIISKKSGLSDGVYILVTVISISIVVIVIIIIVKRRSISHFFKGGDYYVEDDKVGKTSETVCNEDVKYSDLLKHEAT